MDPELSCRAVDPNSFESGSGFSSESGYWIRIRIQGFDDQKLKKKNKAEFFSFFFGSKIAIYLCPLSKLQEKRKVNIQHFKK
jgi:hypothetical protein